jgi:hypothetical protein
MASKRRRQEKGASLHIARKGKDELEMNTKETETPANGQRRHGPPWLSSRREGAQKEKKALGVGVSH